MEIKDGPSLSTPDETTITTEGGGDLTIGSADNGDLKINITDVTPPYECPVCEKTTRDGRVLLKPGEGSGVDEWECCAKCWDKKLEDPMVKCLVAIMESAHKLLHEETTKNLPGSRKTMDRIEHKLDTLGVMLGTDFCAARSGLHFSGFRKDGTKLYQEVLGPDDSDD